MKYDINGLDASLVQQSREKHGSNRLTPPEIEGFWDKFKGNFDDPIIKILMVALVINIIFMFMGKTEWFESLGIAIAVILATMIATWSEYSNEESFQKLQDDASKIKCKVFRDGMIQELLIDDIVVGDFILLQTGDKVPADGKLLHGSLNINQASLTGESKEVKKNQYPRGLCSGRNQHRPEQRI